MKPLYVSYMKPLYLSILIYTGSHDFIPYGFRRTERGQEKNDVSSHDINRLYYLASLNKRDDRQYDIIEYPTI